MNRFSMMALTTMAMALPGLALADDMGDVKAASQAFYDAVPVFDNGEAMGKVVAHTPYFVFIHPGATSIIVGWDNFNKDWQAGNKMFKTRIASVVEADVHVNANVAWEATIEHWNLETKTGEKIDHNFMATSVFEKIDGHWLLVSRHANPLPDK